MNKKQIEKLQIITRELFMGGPKVVFSSHSLTILTSFFYQELIKTSTQGDDSVNELLEYWKSNVLDFRQQLLDSAISGNSFVTIKGIKIPLIREDDAIKGKEKCPPGPEDIA